MIACRLAGKQEDIDKMIDILESNGFKIVSRSRALPYYPNAFRVYLNIELD